MTNILTGTSGFSYSDWKDGIFYPKGLPRKKWLEYYASVFNTVELNVTFYRLPKKETFQDWHRRTPDNFLFTLKASRYITHIKRLKNCQKALGNFLENALFLKNKLGVILWQLPPSMRIDTKTLESFCDLLFNSDAKKIKHVFEFRHPSWLYESVYEILEKYNYCLCIAHSNQWPNEEISTADYLYLRFHGGESLYSSDYSDKELKGWARKVKKWISGKREVFSYFNNDAKGYAPRNALIFRKLLEKAK